MADYLGLTLYLTIPAGFGWVLPAITGLVVAMIVKFILRITPIV